MLSIWKSPTSCHSVKDKYYNSFTKLKAFADKSLNIAEKASFQETVKCWHCEMS